MEKCGFSDIRQGDIFAQHAKMQSSMLQLKVNCQSAFESLALLMYLKQYYQF